MKQSAGSLKKIRFRNLRQDCKWKKRERQIFSNENETAYHYIPWRYQKNNMRTLQTAI